MTLEELQIELTRSLSRRGWAEVLPLLIQLSPHRISLRPLLRTEFHAAVRLFRYAWRSFDSVAWWRR